MPILAQAFTRLAVSVAGAALVVAMLLRPGLAQEQTQRFRTVERAIPNRYIVLLNEEPLRSRIGSERAAITSTATDLARTFAGQVGHVYQHAVKAFRTADAGRGGESAKRGSACGAGRGRRAHVDQRRASESAMGTRPDRSAASAAQSHV